jgi:CRISPR-associated protein Cas1
LISAKLNNYAALARTYTGTARHTKLAVQLDQLSQRALAASDLDQLRGFEGAGAAMWYGQFQTRLGKGFEFQQREYPFAADPVNVLLNLTHSIMHRLVMLVLIRNGFATSIGVFHTASTTHAALASDLQEVYRHLMDRVVIEATHTLTPSVFTQNDAGTYPLKMDSSAYRAVVAAVFRTLSIETRLVGKSDPRSYFGSMRADVHNLRRHLANRNNRFQPFRHF